MMARGSRELDQITLVRSKYNRTLSSCEQCVEVLNSALYVVMLLNGLGLRPAAECLPDWGGRDFDETAEGASEPHLFRCQTAGL